MRIAAWHVDEDESGGTQHRPGLREAMRRVEDRETGGIACWRLNRFARNVAEALKDVERVRAVGGVLALVEEDIDPTGPFGELTLTVLLAVAALELNNVKAGWRTAKEEAIARGVPISRTAFGYARVDDGDDKGKLVPHPICGPIVTEAFGIAAGEGLSATVAFLAERASHKTWTADTTRRFLARPVYLGRVQYGEIVRADVHDALVTRTIWEAANRNAENGGKRRAPSADFPLSHIAQCGSCGGPMVGGRGGSDARRTYRCARRCDKPLVISADPLEAHVVDVLREAFRHPGFEVGTGSPAVAEATAALEEAEQELDAFASDVTARKLLGDRYHHHLQQRVGAVEQAHDALHAAMDAADATHVVVPAELWDDLTPGELGDVLRGGLASVIVGPARRGRPVGERVRVVPKGTHGDALAGAEDPQERSLDA